jgi:hypothetical protein
VDRSNDAGKKRGGPAQIHGGGEFEMMTRGAITITKAERGDLLSVARLNVRVAKAQAGQRAAELMADFERQLASIYSFDQRETWRAVNAGENVHRRAGVKMHH